MMQHISTGLFLRELYHHFNTFVKTFFVALFFYKSFYKQVFQVLKVIPIDHSNHAYQNDFCYLKPFAFVGMAAGLTAVLIPFKQAMLLDIAHHHPMFSPEAVEMMESLATHGPNHIILKIFGIPILGEALQNLVQYLAFLLFGMIVSVFAGPQAPKKAMAYTLLYLSGIGITIQLIFDLVTALVYWTILGADATLGLQVSTGIGAGVAFVMMGYLLVMPAYILSATLQSRKRTVLRGMCLAFFVLMIFVAGIQFVQDF